MLFMKYICEVIIQKKKLDTSRIISLNRLLFHHAKLTVEKNYTTIKFIRTIRQSKRAYQNMIRLRKDASICYLSIRAHVVLGNRL